MESLYNELRIEIFKFVDTPISLALTNKKWYAISQDPQSRADWLIFKYGHAHALFHAVRLGNSFLTSEVLHSLLSKNAIISRYFIQRLLMHFGPYDEKLIELKIEHNVNQVDFDRIRAFQKKLSSPWASNLPLPIFTKLITAGYNILNDENLVIKGNDMELFHFLSAGPLVINQAPQKLFQNLADIKDLIINKKFVPFPPRPKPAHEDTVEYIQLMQSRAHEEYPPKDGYENSRQLNVIARAILIYPDLVTLWKEIGYYEICSDVNDLVMQGALLILFPPTPPADWERPDTKIVVKRLKQLINLGFKLTASVMEEALHLFEHKLNEIGDVLLESFQIIHKKKSKSAIASLCLIQAIKPERSHRKTDLLEFLNDRIDQPEKAMKNALECYKVGFRYNTFSIKKIKIRSLSVHSNLYYWILKKFGPNSEATQKCFEDIMESRIWIDLKSQEILEREIPDHLTRCAFNAICSIYLEFCNERIPFKANYLQYLTLVNNEEIIRPLFEISLPNLFGLELKCNSYKIDYEYNRPEIDNNENNKRKYTDMNEQPEHPDRSGWIRLLEDLQTLVNNNTDITETFRNNFEKFLERITSSQNQEINEEVCPKRLKQ
ncbi:hypothetical protein RhiirA5_424872 [Rhizophagus irregularis]|uniref:F-box domain-containing protein n=2 Tax=Rhizophagus irregularis TaxID=588596 RepID=A0A2N0P774_9GLOM|nr:hypothetical protein RhiirA5_424872 [Rhizophagus irregularis]CAB5378089.1 unnamed protein product [Rhizophagus irregularis]